MAQYLFWPVPLKRHFFTNWGFRMLSDKATVLFEQGNHKCLVFSDLVKGEGVQSNQFLIVHGSHSALLDPGGDLTFAPLSLAIRKHVPVKSLTYIIASHQDPDIIAALDRWMMQSDARVVCSRLWARFLPHLSASYHEELGVQLSDRLLSLEDDGQAIPMGDVALQAVPAHFLHSVGNFHFYDPVSKILFSGDVGSSMIGEQAYDKVRDFQAHTPLMEGFHQRYMASNRACRIWVDRVRTLDIEMIVPQHGLPFVGKPMVEQFLDWMNSLVCGIDLMG